TSRAGSVLAEGLRQAVEHRPHQVVEEGALARPDEDVGRHAGRGAEIRDLALDAPGVDAHPHHVERALRLRLAPRRGRGELGGQGIGRQVDYPSFDHGGGALVQGRELDERALALPDVPDLAGVQARLDDELVVDGQKLEDDRAGGDHAARRVLVQLDDDAADGGANLYALDDVARGAGLLLDVVELGLDRAQLLDRLLQRGGAQLGDLLLGAGDALLRTGDARRQLAELSGQARLRALHRQHLGLARQLPLQQPPLVLQLLGEQRAARVGRLPLRQVAVDALVQAGNLLAQHLLLRRLLEAAGAQLDRK